MLHITRTGTSDLFFTGTEQAVLTNPYFLFIFTNRATLDVVRYVGTNVSAYKSRYDKVVISGSLFDDYDAGLWGYEIYEQAAATGTDTTGKNKVEEGYMILTENDNFNPDQYSGQNNTFVTYEPES